MRRGQNGLLIFLDITKLSVFDGFTSTSQLSAQFEIVPESEFKAIAAC